MSMEPKIATTSDIKVPGIISMNEFRFAWRMSNSHRQDLTKLEPNFMGRELKELLPPGERLIARNNTQPFILDHGDDTTDFPGDEFLLGYWLGRYVGAIGEAK